MNKQRKKRIAEAVELISQAKDLLEIIGEEEEAAFDNLPEGLQESARGEQMEANADAMAEAYDYLDEAIDALEDAELVDLGVKR